MSDSISTTGTTTDDDRPSTEEVMESLNGFDEIAITKQWGDEILNLADKRPLTFVRALVFIQERRLGLDDAAAKAAVMEMTIGDVQERFRDDDEMDPNNPETATGKDD